MSLKQPTLEVPHLKEQAARRLSTDKLVSNNLSTKGTIMELLPNVKENKPP